MRSPWDIALDPIRNTLIDLLRRVKTLEDKEREFPWRWITPPEGMEIDPDNPQKLRRERMKFPATDIEYAMQEEINSLKARIEQLETALIYYTTKYADAHDGGRRARQALKGQNPDPYDEALRHD